MNFRTKIQNNNNNINNNNNTIIIIKIIIVIMVAEGDWNFRISDVVKNPDTDIKPLW